MPPEPKEGGSSPSAHFPLKIVKWVWALMRIGQRWKLPQNKIKIIHSFVICKMYEY